MKYLVALGEIEKWLEQTGVRDYCRKVCSHHGCCNKIKFKEKVFFIANNDVLYKKYKMIQFLEKINRQDSRNYSAIDHIFVPPVEYYEIKTLLKKNRFIFITGTKEYGKTFTAIRLMWEYFYNLNYEPIWVKGGEEKERAILRESLEDITYEIKPHHIVYFEDPFGKTKYEKRESLEREIGTIIDSFRETDDVYFILTSREEVFKKFKKENLSTKDLRIFEKKLNIKTPSYDTDKRKQILNNWANEFNCKWLRNFPLSLEISNSLESKKTLPTLLSIRDFCKSSKNVVEKSKLLDILNEKSKETQMSFANELRDMSYDKLLFLSFPFISESICIEYIEEIYQNLIIELKLNEAYDFDEIKNWFIDDKIDFVNINYNSLIRNRDYRILIDKNVEKESYTFILFSHPSYKEAFKNLIYDKNKKFTDINLRIFCKILLKLSRNNYLAKHVILFIEKNYLLIPGHIFEKLIINLMKNQYFSKEDSEFIYNKVVYWVGLFIVNKNVLWDENFKFSENIINNLLLELSKKYEVIRSMSKLLSIHFQSLPVKLKNGIVKNIIKNDYRNRYVTLCLLNNYENLSQYMEGVLFSNKNLAYDLIDYNSYYNPNNVINLLIKAFNFFEKDYINTIVKEIEEDNQEIYEENLQKLKLKLKSKKS